MQLDKQKLSLLLSLPDAALRQILSDVAKEAGVDPGALGLDLGQLDKVRAALASATDADLAAIQKLLEEQKERR
ncbi:MAG: hypothetical protein IJR88_02550 [Clostridia bacterium]|nr:hypothetical protein [Clostridia bacterium]